MAQEHPKIEHELPNGDVLIIATNKRDPEVEAVFGAARAKAREDIRSLFHELRSRRAA